MSFFKKKWVKVISIIAIVIICIIGSGYLVLEYLVAQLTGQLAGCTLETKQFTSVLNFEYVGNWIIVKAKVNGSEKEFDFIFDTGAQTVFSDSLFKELGTDNYKTTKVQTNSEGHAFKNEIIALDRLELSDVVYRDVGAMIVESEKYGMLNCVSPYGIIGYNVLQTCNYQIDYEKKQIRITDQLGTLPNMNEVDWLNYTTLDQETPIVEATINDAIKVKLFFDTGYSGGISLTSIKLFDKIGKAYPDQNAQYTAKSNITIRGKEGVYQAMKFNSSTFRLGNNVTNDILISIKNNEEREFTGLMGNKYFEKFIITLDYKNKRVGFSPRTNHENLPTNKTFGLDFMPVGDKIYVNLVYLDSDADKQGISIGDEIISINGIRVSDLSPETFCDIYTYKYQFIKSDDSLLVFEIERNGQVIKYNLKRYELFNMINNMILIHGDEFPMGDVFKKGSENEQPVHQVKLSDFYLSEYEVSRGDFKQFVGATGYKTSAEAPVDETATQEIMAQAMKCLEDKDKLEKLQNQILEYGGSGYWNVEECQWAGYRSDINWKNPGFKQEDSHPVIAVSWNDAIYYCNWLSEQNGLQPAYNTKTGDIIDENGNPTDNITIVKGFRLPTEAEWEYAARESGQEVMFGNGKNIARASEINFRSNEGSQSFLELGGYIGGTTQVGHYPPNKNNLFDMSGNAWEWVSDKYASYTGQKKVNPYITNGNLRILRGGRWGGDVMEIRTTHRSTWVRNDRCNNSGFRIARSKQ